MNASSKPCRDTFSRLSERLCRHAGAFDFAAIPSEVVERTKLHFLDFLAVAFGGGHAADPSPVLLRGIRKAGGGMSGRCTIIGEEKPIGPQYAAFLNAAFAHSMDYDDTHQDAAMHPGTTIFPTLLALAEDRHRTGADFVAAAVLGYDIACKLGRTHGSAVHRRGFHPTATTGIFACTLAGGRLLRMPPDQVENAFGLNISQAAGTLQYQRNGAWDKCAHTGFAAHNAILSLLLAEEGYLGAREPIEGDWGYLALFAEGELLPSRIVDGLGRDFEIMRTGLKPYPACRCSHGTIDLLRAIAHEERVRPEDIAGLDITLSPFGAKLVAEPEDAKRAAATVVDAQFSIYFAAAVAAVEDFTWSSYERHMNRTDTRRFIDRVNVRVDASCPRYGTRLALRMRGGGVVVRSLDNPRGEPDNPLTFDDIGGKFGDLAEPVIGPRKAAVVIDQVARLDSLSDVRDLGRHLRSGGRSDR